MVGLGFAIYCVYGILGESMTINSRQKGAQGEREAAEFFRNLGHSCRRGQQYSGGAGSPDIIVESLPGYHFEVKRVERGSLYDWLAQAIRDAGGSIPCVAHRRSRCDWVAVTRLEDFVKMATELELWRNSPKRPEIE